MYHAELSKTAIQTISTIKEIQSTPTHAPGYAPVCTLMINRIHSHML